MKYKLYCLIWIFEYLPKIIMKLSFIAPIVSFFMLLSACTYSGGDSNDLSSAEDGEFSATMTGDWSGSTNLNYSYFGFSEGNEDEPAGFMLVASNDNPLDWEEEFEPQSEYTFIFFREGNMINPNTYMVGNLFNSEMEDGDLPAGQFGVVVYRIADSTLYMGFSESGTITFDTVSNSGVNGSFAVDLKAVPFVFDQEQPDPLEISVTGNFQALSGNLFVDI